MTPPPRARRSRRLLGIVCIAGALLIPLGWAVARVATDPQFSMSDAEAVYDYTVAHTRLSAEQTTVLNDAVIYAHGNSHLVRFLPILLLISGVMHLKADERSEDAKA